MHAIRYCLHGLVVLIRKRPGPHLICLAVCSIVFAAIPLLFSNTLMVWSESYWANRVAKVSFRSDVSASALYDRLAENPRVNGFLLNIDIQQQGDPEKNTIMLNAVRGIIYERNKGNNALLGDADKTDRDVFLLRQMDIPEKYRFRMDEMVTFIDGTPYRFAHLCGSIGANYGHTPSLGNGLVITYQDDSGEEQLFESKYSWGTLVAIPAATAAKHDYPVSALEISFADLGAASVYHEIMAPFQSQIESEYLPWSDQPLMPSLDESTPETSWNIISELICLLNLMVLLLLWLGSFHKALCIWLREGALSWHCHLSLFIIGILMVILSMLLGFGIYALLLPLGIRAGLLTALPLNLVSLLCVVYLIVAVIYLAIYCRRCVRTAQKGGYTE